MTRHFNKKESKEKRKLLRNNAPQAEKLLWNHLKKSQIRNQKFRRQYSVDQFIVDFYCPNLKLAIEIDGPSHFKQDYQAYDNERQNYLEAFGITFLRFTNNDVYDNLYGVLLSISDKIDALAI
jgi:very-short-patch-repair endonuclease